MKASYSNSLRFFQSSASSSAGVERAEPAEEDELLRRRDGGDRVHLQEAEPSHGVEHARRGAVEQLRAHGDPPGLLRCDDPRASHVEPGVLEVEVADDAAHHVVADHALLPQVR